MIDSAPLARIGVLIVNYNTGPWLARALQSIQHDHDAGPDVLIVDNGSVDNSLDALPPARWLTIDRVGQNLGFAGAIQRGLQHIRHEFVLILNPDCLITPNDLIRLAKELKNHPKAGLVSGRVVGEDGLEQRASRRQLPTPKRILAELLPGRSGHAGFHAGIDLSQTPAPDQSAEIEAVSGACMLIRRAALEQIGGFDTGYPLHFEDLDLFARLRQAGWTLRWCPDVNILHAGGQSSKKRPVYVLWAKHRGLWRYLNQHCKSQWPAWQRPIWAVMLITHAAAKTPLVWLKTLRSNRS